MVTAVASALTVSRRPDAVFNAQFWAEDGARWYANAYNWGWVSALFSPVTGYFQTVSRLTAALSLMVDIRYAPLVFNVAALVIQVLPAFFVVSPRLARVIPDFRLRLLLALLYIGVPNSFEVHANITNSMTHLGLLAVLIVLAPPSPRPGWRLFDITFVVLSGLSGPFAIALFPVAFLRWITDRASRWRLVLFCAVTVCALIQAAAVLISSPAGRPHPPLGATPHGFTAIVAGNVYAGAVIGLNHLIDVFGQPWWGPHSLAERLVFVAGTAVLAYAAIRGTAELRLFILFSWTLLIAALLTPVMTLAGDQWPLLAHPGAGDRYYLIPMLAFMAALVWMLVKAAFVGLRLAAGLVLAVTLLVGMPGDWNYAPFLDLTPRRYAELVDRSAPGTRLQIPINPPGWRVELTKK